jgi:hypothetical protein
MSVNGWADVRWVIGLLIIATVFYLIHRLERQIRARGTLFPRSRPVGARRLALLLGLLVIGFCTVCWLSGAQLYGFILVGIALIGYGLDYGVLLELVQGTDDLAMEIPVYQEHSRRRPNTHPSQVLDP